MKTSLFLCFCLFATQFNIGRSGFEFGDPICDIFYKNPYIWGTQETDSEIRYDYCLCGPQKQPGLWGQDTYCCVTNEKTCEELDIEKVRHKYYPHKKETLWWRVMLKFARMNSKKALK